MGEAFVAGTIDLVSGEKDPRNLMVIFSLLRVVMVEWDIKNHVEVVERHRQLRVCC
jgi:DNA repair/transcription protein MET18/MMS19